MTRRALQAVPDVARTAIVYLRVSTKEQAQRGGDPEGYSIPAQRSACLRKAEALGAQVVAEFVDAGESARSADRPELQQMLKHLSRNSADFVIVHKVDRLARNRYDDAVITAAIQATGAQLVSVSENIDETPSGLLLHGIMSSIAEFYSRNLSAEVVKGTQQKVSAGGTPHTAPIGYLNVRKLVEGREVRTVELDPERAEHVRWAFTTYASGEYSLNRLAAELEVRGLTQRPSPQRAARPLPANKLHAVLRNRYYLGFVTWQGVEYEGKHEPLVSAEVFEQVQRVLSNHRAAGERSSRHHHYLTGTVYCARCGSRLQYGVARGRHGDLYPYYFCLGRHTRRNGCTLPYLRLELVEQAVERQWLNESLPIDVVEALRENLRQELGQHESQSSQNRQQLTQRRDKIKRERYRWADLAMQGAVPGDIAAEKQLQLADQLLAVEASLERVAREDQDHQSLLTAALALVPACAAAYTSSGAMGRRDYNQAWFKRLELDADEGEVVRVEQVERTELMGALREAGAAPAGSLTEALAQEERRRHGDHGGVERVDVSSFELVVGDEGLEPPTLSV